MQMNSANGSITLDTTQVIGSGGEAKVYAVKGKRKVAKIYNQPTIKRGGKLLAMVGHAPTDPGRTQGHVSIAWPEDVLFDSAGLVAGFLMPAIQNSFSFTEVYHPGARQQSLPAGFGYQYLLRTAYNLCMAVSAVHDMGYVIGDLNDSNILVQGDARVTLIDCDSFQVGPYRCLVGRPEYTAPELQGANLSVTDRTDEQDCFALAILVYQLLMSGYHPYAGVGEPGELSERIRVALCSHAPGGPKPQRGAPPLNWLPASLQQMFINAFVDGHSFSSARPQAQAWAAELLRSEKELKKCRNNINHPYFKHQKNCSACQANAARSRKPLKAHAVKNNKNKCQQPLPGLRVSVKGSVQRKAILAIVLTFITILTYHWPSLMVMYEEVKLQSRSYSGGINRFAKSTPVIPPPSVRKNQRVKTGSEIYQEQIDQYSYQQPKKLRLPYAIHDNSISSQISNRNQLPKLETGSEIYKRYIGESSY